MRGGVCVQEDSTRSHRLVNCTCSPRPPALPGRLLLVHGHDGRDMGARHAIHMSHVSDSAARCDGCTMLACWPKCSLELARRCCVAARMGAA